MKRAESTMPSVIIYDNLYLEDDSMTQNKVKIENDKVASEASSFRERRLLCQGQKQIIDRTLFYIGK